MSEPFVFFLPASLTFTQTNAPIVAVKLGETGYYPIYTQANADDLNDHPIPEEVAKSAICASMFGWDTKAAQLAIEFAKANQAKEGA